MSTPGARRRIRVREAKANAESAPAARAAAARAVCSTRGAYLTTITPGTYGAGCTRVGVACDGVAEIAPRPAQAQTSAAPTAARRRRGARGAVIDLVMMLGPGSSAMGFSTDSSP